jgi:hypothetical protein
MRLCAGQCLMRRMQQMSHLPKCSSSFHHVHSDFIHSEIELCGCVLVFGKIGVRLVPSILLNLSQIDVPILFTRTPFCECDANPNPVLGCVPCFKLTITVLINLYKLQYFCTINQARRRKSCCKPPAQASFEHAW